MALTITQKITSTQSGQEPKELRERKTASRQATNLQSQVTPTVPRSVDNKVSITSDTYRWAITRSDSDLIRGRSIAPLVSPSPRVEVNGFRLSEKVHGWGGTVVFFLNLFPDLCLLFSGITKWSAAAGRGRWEETGQVHYAVFVEGTFQC
jgi:hypothetical protein